MKNEKKMTFKLKGENGKEIECEVLFTFESDETKKNYIVYTDNTTDENGKIRVFASIYQPDQDETTLEPIETDHEWKLIEKILDEVQAEAKKAISSAEGENE